MFRRNAVVVCAVVVAAGAFAALAGCDWLKASEPGVSQAPVLTTLNVTPVEVFCRETPPDAKDTKNTFSISFRYNDSQGDIARVSVTRQRSGETAQKVDTPLWPVDQNPSSGTVTFKNFFFACESKGGIWSIKVTVEDERGHLSNVLSGEIRLNTAG